MSAPEYWILAACKECGTIEKIQCDSRKSVCIAVYLINSEAMGLSCLTCIPKPKAQPYKVVQYSMGFVITDQYLRDTTSLPPKERAIVEHLLTLQESEQKGMYGTADRTKMVD